MSDVVVVGGGSAGAALVGRLSEDAARSVVLFEAGADYRAEDAPAEMVGPNFQSLLDRGGFHWPTLTASSTDARAPVPYHCGYGLGGGSAVNAQIAIRPMPSDFDAWPVGWAWDNVLRSFIKLEADLDFGHEPYHGNGGPIPVVREPITRWGPVDLAVREAAEATGHGWCVDYNAPASTGVSPVASNTRDGRRVSTNDAYLEGRRYQSNLRIVGDALVDRVIVERGRAVGVRVRVDGQWTEQRAQEVILAAGAIGSPAILMRSGIGDATELRSLGLDAIVDLPGVGTNLKEHPRIVIGLALREGAQCDPEDVRPVCCYVRFDSSTGPRNDLLLMSSNWTPGSTRFGAVSAALMAPTSTGSVRLASVDPTVDPRVVFRMASTTDDQERLREAARHLFGLAQHEAFRSVADAAVVGRTGRLIEDFRDDAVIDDWIADECVEFHHPTGTCRMGDPRDADVVVDPSCRVVGVEGLRVADASIFPDIPRANTNLAAIMVGEHLATLTNHPALP